MQNEIKQKIINCFEVGREEDTVKLLLDYILQEKQKSYNQGVIDTVDKIADYARGKVAIGYGGFGLLELCKKLKQSAKKSLGEK